MREFEVSLTKALKRGLRAFPKNELDVQFLSECYNFMPSETGLIPHERIQGIAWSSAYFNYLEIKDQNGVSWFWYPAFDGHIFVGPDIPSEITTGLDAIPINNSPVPYWVNILDENSDIWRLYPDSATGETRAKDSDPGVGTGISNLRWVGTTTEVWENKFNSVDKYRYAVKV